MQKFVITGGPCTGKTTTINILAEKGFPVIHEIATEIIKEDIKNNLKEDVKDFHLKILERQLKAEKSNKESLIFLDRSIVDTLAYLLLNGLNYREHFKLHIENADYTKVFFLENLESYKKNEVRKEDPEKARKIHNKILETYGELGFDVIIVPKMSAEERADFILKNSVEQ